MAIILGFILLNVKLECVDPDQKLVKLNGIVTMLKEEIPVKVLPL